MLSNTARPESVINFFFGISLLFFHASLISGSLLSSWGKIFVARYKGKQAFPEMPRQGLIIDFSHFFIFLQRASKF